MRLLPILTCCLVATACDRSDSTASQNGTPIEGNGSPGLSDSPRCTNSPEWLTGGFVMSCGDAEMRFEPLLKVNDEWTSADRCHYEDPGWRCEYEQVGTLTIRKRDDHSVSAHLRADNPVLIEGFEWRGAGRLPGARAMLSNGFQSWSQSGVVGLPDTVPAEELQRRLSRRGDVEVIRDGRFMSWWHSFIAGDTHLVVGVTSANQFKSWVSASGHEDNIDVRLVSGGMDDRISMDAGGETELETWFFGLSADLAVTLTRYGEALPHRSSTTAYAEAGWNSWYELWDSVDAAAVVSNASLVAAGLAGKLPTDDEKLRIVVDDGWQRDWGDWYPNEKFPDGLNGLAQTLREAGFEPGVWLAPLLVSERSTLVATHPDWFIDGPEYMHLKHGAMRILDVTNPEAAMHLSETIERIIGWGYTLLKIDFLFAGTFSGSRHEDITSMASYKLAMELIRDAAGPDVVLLAVGAPPVAGFEQIDSWRMGPDVAVENFGASWFFIQGTARSMSARWPYCIHTLCDGDPPILRDLSPEQAQVSAWVAALAGGAFFLSDDLRALEPGRLDWITPAMVKLGLHGGPAIPTNQIPAEVPFELTSQLADQIAGRIRHQIPLEWSLPTGELLTLTFRDGQEAVDIRTTDNMGENNETGGP